VVEIKENTKVLAVTVLTSLDKNDLRDLGFACDIEALVLSRAKRALALGCDGVISSGLEAAKLRQTLGAQFLIVTPGIRAFLQSGPRRSKTDRHSRRSILARRRLHRGGSADTKSDKPRAQAEQMQETIQRLFNK
jgi:orotidine-5'-phosphate decarboxylase